MYQLAILALFFSSISVKGNEFLKIKEEMSLGHTFTAEKLLYKAPENTSKNWYLALIHFIHGNSLRASESMKKIVASNPSFFSQICPFIVMNERDLNDNSVQNLWKKCKQTLPSQTSTRWMDALILDKIDLVKASKTERPALIEIATSLGKSKYLKKKYNLKKNNELINAYNIYYFRTKEFNKINLKDSESINNLLIIASWAIELKKYKQASAILDSLSQIKEYSPEANKLKELIPSSEISEKKMISLEDILITDYLQEEKDLLLQERIRFLDKKLK